jgi:hypothetical protein
MRTKKHEMQAKEKERNVRVALHSVSERDATPFGGMRFFLALACLAAPIAAVAEEKAALPTMRPVVEAEENVYSFTSANNGAGPMWCHGSTCLVRIGVNVFASGLETLKDAKPLNNCRWTLYERTADGWQLLHVDAGRTREPCPLVTLPGGKLLLSANPTLVADPNVYSGPARPEILQFSSENPKAPFKTLLPIWNGKPHFSEHSYRSFAADGQAGTLILFQNIGYTHVEWTFRDGDGRWAAQGKLVWPWGDTYDKPQPIRVCYPNVAIRGRAVHFCGVSDIVEPYTKWRQYKEKLTGRHWDYDFRRLFYTWSDDITTGKFHDWVEIASRDKTCGWIMPCDLWLDPSGVVHLLWTDRAIDTRLRKEFFPAAKQTFTLWYGRVSRGKLVSQRAIVEAVEGGSQETAQWGRFQVTPDGRLFIVGYIDGRSARGKPLAENRLWELGADGSLGQTYRLPMKYPLARYFTATLRGGSAPSTTLDLLGTTSAAPAAIRYARIRLW